MKKKFFFAVSFLLISCSALHAAGKSGTSALTFLKISHGARAAGMGEMFSAVSDDPLAVYWNPAGLSFQTTPELSTQYFSYIEGTSLQNLAVSLPLPTKKISSLGLGLTYLQSTGFNKTVVANNAMGFEEQGNFTATDMAFHVGYGLRINTQVSFGVAGKFAREKLDDTTATAIAFDVGLILKSIDRPFRLGLLLQNVGTSVSFNSESFPLPQMFRFSVVREIRTKGWIGVEGINANDTDLELRFGAEIPVGSVLFLRGGYKYLMNERELGGSDNITAGIGFAFSYYQLDYAVASYGDFGYTHRVSMNFKFGNQEQRSRGIEPRRWSFEDLF